MKRWDGRGEFLRVTDSALPCLLPRKKRGNRGSSKQCRGTAEPRRRSVIAVHGEILLANGVQDINKSDDGEISKCKYPPPKTALFGERTLSGATAPRPSGAMGRKGWRGDPAVFKP